MITLFALLPQKPPWLNKTQNPVTCVHWLYHVMSVWWSWPRLLSLHSHLICSHRSFLKMVYKKLKTYTHVAFVQRRYVTKGTDYNCQLSFISVSHLKCQRNSHYSYLVEERKPWNLLSKTRNRGNRHEMIKIGSILNCCHEFSFKASCNAGRNYGHLRAVEEVKYLNTFNAFIYFKKHFHWMYWGVIA